MCHKNSFQFIQFIKITLVSALKPWWCSSFNLFLFTCCFMLPFFLYLAQTDTFVSLSLSPSETPAVSVSRCPGGRRGSWAGCYCWTAVAVSQKQTLCATHQQQSIDRKTSQHVRTETPGSSEPLRSDQHVKLPLPIDRFNVPECRRSGSRWWSQTGCLSAGDPWRTNTEETIRLLSQQLKGNGLLQIHYLSSYFHFCVWPQVKLIFSLYADISR